MVFQEGFPEVLVLGAKVCRRISSQLMQKSNLDIATIWAETEHSSRVGSK